MTQSSPVSETVVEASAKAAAEAAGFCWENCAQEQWRRDMRAGLAVVAQCSQEQASNETLRKALEKIKTAAYSPGPGPGRRKLASRISEMHDIAARTLADTSTDRQPPNSICKFCARRVFEPCQSIAQAQNACTLSSPVWPEGCRDGDSCARHKACMYVNCRHNGRSIAGEVEAALADTRPDREAGK